MTFENILQLLSAVLALTAAVFWLLSAKVSLPSFLDTPMNELFKPFQKASKLSAYAAVSAGLSALLQACLVFFFSD
jgi:hypothetical protein